MKLVRTDKEINDLLDACARQIYDIGGTKLRGQTYEEGIYEALRWATGDTDDYPYEDK